MLPSFKRLIDCMTAQGDSKGIFFRNECTAAPALTEYETAAQMKEETR